MLDLNNKSILITGGTGSFGRKFVETVLLQFPKVKRLVIFSRDEYKQFKMSQALKSGKNSPVEFVLGDIRDRDRLNRVFEGIDYVVHAAALKHIPAGELHPMEFIKTNILGAENVIEAALNNRVKHVVFLSSDKAASPSNLYGASKLAAEKLFIAANNYGYAKDCRFSIVRFGNLFGSKGSVLPVFMEQKKNGYLTITDARMTRFNITLEESVELVFHSLFHSMGGEIFIPKLASFKIIDLAEAIAPDCEHRIIGIRPGEKLYEDIIAPSEIQFGYNVDEHFVIAPELFQFWDKNSWLKKNNASKLSSNFVYTSDVNDKWLSVAKIREIVEQFEETEKVYQ